MDEQNNDPYERQLYAVFQSCLVKGQAELQEENWLTLCDKLHLADQSEELRSCIQKHKPEKRSVSFPEFRSALITLLGKSQELNTRTETVISSKHSSPCSVDYKKSEPSKSNADSEILNVKTGGPLDENRLKCLWEKINSCLKENVDSTTMYFISNCLGIPALPKQITQCIFEKLDQNCDGLISLEEFLVIFQHRKALQEQLSLDCNEEPLNNLSKGELKKRGSGILSARNISNTTKTSNLLEMWKVAEIPGTPSLLSQGDVDLSDICLADLTTTLCDELKNLNDTLDHSTVRSHITLLRDVLILYQGELHRLNLLVENISGEKEKLRADMIEANERANALAQEIDEQHARQEEARQNFRKQIEQRHSEMIQDLSDQLSLERETNALALKSREEQIQTLQRENHEMKNKFVTTLKQYQNLEIENEGLLSRIEKLKVSNNDLLSQMKILAAEHDEVESNEAKQQQEVIFLVDRIKELQSKAVLLRDQNDELRIELETLRLRDCQVKDKKGLGSSHTTRDIQEDETDDNEMFDEEEEPEYDLFFKHSTPMPSDSPIEDCIENCKTPDGSSLKESIITQLQNILANSNNCTAGNCVFREEISSLLNRLQSDMSMHSVKQELEKSIASELETDCEEPTRESLRDFVVPKHKNSILAKRASINNSSNNLNSDAEDMFDNQPMKSVAQNKKSSLRDYPPRKEEHSQDSRRLSKEKETKKENNAVNATFVKSELVVATTDGSQKLNELEATHMAEKKQLTERCSMLERSLELLKTEYEECEDYWAAKLEEERQLFEQEQKISDEKFSELIAKMAEYEELLSPVDKTKSGRLSPIEEKFNLEQQYLDLEEEFEKWKSQVEEEISQKEKEIQRLQEKLKSAEPPETVDCSTQVTEDISLSGLTQSNHIPDSGMSRSNELTKLHQCMENIQRLSVNYKPLSNDLSNRAVKEESMVDHPVLETQPADNAYKFEKSTHRKKPQIGAKSSSVMTEEDMHEVDCDLIQDALRLQELKTGTCYCTRETQGQICCVDVNILQNLNMKLQAQERKKHQLQEFYKQQQHYTEHVVHHLISQHQMEVAELQCLLRNTQEKLQMEFQTSVQQAERLARADVLVKDLYIENACLMANIKRLEQNYHILTGFNAESTSI